MLEERSKSKELYKENEKFLGSRCLTLKSIPQVLASFLKIHLDGNSRINLPSKEDQKVLRMIFTLLP